MLSKNSFFLSAIVGSIVHMTVGGPLDCISVKLPNLKDLGKTSTNKIPREHKNVFYRNYATLFIGKGGRANCIKP